MQPFIINFVPHETLTCNNSFTTAVKGLLFLQEKKMKVQPFIINFVPHGTLGSEDSSVVTVPDS